MTSPPEVRKGALTELTRLHTRDAQFSLLRPLLEKRI